MSDTVTIKTTGGDIHITPDVTKDPATIADRIIDAIEDGGSESDWLRFNVDRGQALVHVPSITGVIALRAGKTRSY